MDKIENLVEMLSRIKAWQESPLTHELTCGNEFCKNSILEPKIDIEERVILICPKCGKIQTNIPEVCIKLSAQALKEQEIRLYKILEKNKIKLF